MISLEHIPFLASSFVKFLSNDVDGNVLVFDKYCLRMLSGDSLPIVKDAVKSSEKLVVVYSNEGITIAPECSVLPKKEVKDESGLELVGCPLECPFSANDSAFECSILSNSRNGAFQQSDLLPLPTDEANLALSLFNSLVKNIKKESASITIPLLVVLCDGNDPAYTRALGLQRLNGSVKRFRITYKEDVLPITSLPKLDSIKRDHVQKTLNSAVNVSVKAKYVVLESCENVMGSESEIILECDWKSPVKVLEIPSSKAKCVAHFSIILGDYRSPANQKWKELLQLENFLISYESNSSFWIKRESETSVTHCLRQLMINWKTAFSKAKSEVKEKRLEFDFANCLIEERKNMEFTDMLWNVVKDCTSCEELKDCLEIVLDGAVDGEIKPSIFGRNRSKFGLLISDIYHKKCGLPNITNQMSLEYVIEIGIEKLRQDYMHMFLVSGLATKDILDSFTSIECTTFTDRMLALKKLHLATEIIALTQNYINSSHALLSPYTRMVIKRVSDLESIRKCNSFAFPIDRRLLVEYFTEYLPSVWTVAMSLNQNLYVSETTHRFCVGDPGYCERLSKKLKKDDVNGERLYYVCIAAVVSDEI